jgi:hypothetical protein
MLRKRLGLSTEPQPVFVGGCFTLIMLLMQIYVFQIGKSGKLITLFNNPLLLFGTMLDYYGQEGDYIGAAVWIGKFVVPLLMLICALAYGKKYAKWLAVPGALPALYAVEIISYWNFNLYFIPYALYVVTAVFYLLTAFGVIKSVKPFIAYCIVVCAGIIIATVFRMPPFTLFDDSIYLSDMIYFVVYHITVANFARAVPMQKKAAEEAKAA